MFATIHLAPLTLPLPWESVRVWLYHVPRAPRARISRAGLVTARFRCPRYAASHNIWRKRYDPPRYRLWARGWPRCLALAVERMLTEYGLAPLLLALELAI